MARTERITTAVSNSSASSPTTTTTTTTTTTSSPTTVNGGVSQVLNEGKGNSTAAILAKVAAAQDAARSKTSSSKAGPTSSELEVEAEAESQPPLPPKGSQPTISTPSTTSATATEVVSKDSVPLPQSHQPQQHPPRTSSSPAPPPATMPSVTPTSAVIQRIAEKGTTPLKVATSGPQPAVDARSSKSRSKPPKTSTSKYPSSAVSPSPGTPTHGIHIRQRAPSAASTPEQTIPPQAQRPDGPPRSSSQEKKFLAKFKKSKDQIQADGLKAANFINKMGHQTWDKIKSQRLTAKTSGHLHGRSSSPQMNPKDNPARDTSRDVDVFGMDLKEAVRKTRIVRTRKISGDAAYWMPAIAYRCLQYLNVYGPHELGIYRISGSTSVVDDLRADFKIRHDVDLFEQPPDDLHTVSSLLKGWFRSLPEAVLPQEVQRRIYDKCKDETESPRPPQAFIEELSNLPPYNYYLLHHLFSHLSTICLASDVNKMGLANLGMIFCSTLRIDRFCFNWLVNSWADCWAGCHTEEEEYQRILMEERVPSIGSISRPGTDHSTTPVERWPSTSSHSVDQIGQGNQSIPTRSSSRAQSDKGLSMPEKSVRPESQPSENVNAVAEQRTMSMVVEAGGTPRDSTETAQPSPIPVPNKPTVMLVKEQ